MLIATTKVKGENDLQNTLKQRSLGGGAWVASVMPFTHDVRLHQFPNAALAREQRRGYSADR
jgi:hypothetical protein